MMKIIIIFLLIMVIIGFIGTAFRSRK